MSLVFRSKRQGPSDGAVPVRRGLEAEISVSGKAPVEWSVTICGGGGIFDCVEVDLEKSVGKSKVEGDT